MEISCESKANHAIMNLTGRLDALGAPQLEEQGRAAICAGTCRLLLDLEKIEYISSAGLRSLLVLAKACAAAGGRLVLCSLAPMVMEVMRMSGFDNIIKISADRKTALIRLATDD